MTVRQVTFKNKYRIEGDITWIQDVKGEKDLFFVDTEDLEIVMLYRRWWLVKDIYPVTNIGLYFSNLKLGCVLLGCMIENKGKGWEIDHINRNPLDNRRNNLRWVTTKINKQNRNCKGYSIEKGKYRAMIMKDGRSIKLGSFIHEKDAREAYLRAKVIYHPEAPTTDLEEFLKSIGKSC